MKWLFFIGTVFIALIVVAVQVWSLGTDVGPAEDCVEQFMSAGQSRDYASADALYVGLGASKSDIQDFIDENYDELFAEYDHVESSGWRVDTKESQSTNMSLSVIRGDIVYSDGAKLSFNAGLTRYDGSWKIWSITIDGNEL
jgi:hypothetical protein